MHSSALECKCVYIYTSLYIYCIYIFPYTHLPDDGLIEAETCWRYVSKYILCRQMYTVLIITQLLLLHSYYYTVNY
jgi:hypothetical protein